MSDAFRSELQAAQERLRRAADENAALREEVTKLETRLSPAQRPRNLWLGGVMIATLSGVAVGAVVTIAETSQRKELEASVALNMARVSEELRARDMAAVECQQKTLELSTELAVLRHPPPPSPSPPPASCKCQQGDPLCSCELDRAAVAAALQSAHVASCVTTAPPRSVHVSLTFAPTGAVTTAVIDAGSEALTEAERTCVTRELRGIHVPAFAGPPTTVGKTYTLGR